jgi:hypothetical protein
MTDMMTTSLDFQALWSQGVPYSQFVAEAQKNLGLWDGVYRTAKIPEWAVERACARDRITRFLVIAEDWCGDASSTVPVLAKLSDLASCLEMRVIGRDAHPEVMNCYLTNRARAIPVVIALDDAFNEVGHWGPRPDELQSWVREHRDEVPTERRYRRSRRWYAMDQGETTLREVLALLD